MSSTEDEALSAPDAGSPGGSWLWGRYSGLGLVVLILTALADQANKYWMLHIYGIEQKGPVALTSWFDLMYVINTGVSYGLGASDSQLAQYGWVAFACVASVALWVWMTRQTARIAVIGLALIVGGAIGNAVDRLHLGGVADFYVMRVFGYSTNVFNVADAAIVVGVVALLYDSFFGSGAVAAKAT